MAKTLIRPQIWGKNCCLHLYTPLVMGTYCIHALDIWNVPFWLWLYSNSAGRRLVVSFNVSINSHRLTLCLQRKLLTDRPPPLSPSCHGAILTDRQAEGDHYPLLHLSHSTNHRLRVINQRTSWILPGKHIKWVLIVCVPELSCSQAGKKKKKKRNGACVIATNPCSDYQANPKGDTLHPYRTPWRLF